MVSLAELNTKTWYIKCYTYIPCFIHLRHTNKHTSSTTQACCYNVVGLCGMQPCLTKPRAARWTEPNEWQMKSKPREKQEKYNIIKWSLGAHKHTSPNKGKTLESKTQSICSERGERSHMFLISPVAEQGEVMMKSSLSSGQVQLHWAVCMLNGFGLTNTHMHFHTFWCAIKKKKVLEIKS